MVIIFCRVTTNTQVANTEPSLAGKYKVRFLQVSGDNILPNDQNITLFHVCFCFKRPYLMYIVDLLTLNSWPTAL